jgi:hypothetical protein
MERTMSPLRSLSVLLFAVAASAATAMLACETETATSAVVDNAYPAPPEGADPALQTVVYRAWWVATYFQDPVAGGAASAEQRSIPASEVAYAVLAPEWDPASTTPPSRLIVVKSKAPLTSTRGELLHIAVSDQTFTGNCLAAQPLSQEEADFITQRIFPGEFEGVTYDAKTCTSTAVPTDEAGVDAGTDAAGDAGSDADAGPG